MGEIKVTDVTTNFTTPSAPERATRLAVNALTRAHDDARFITWYSTWAECCDLNTEDVEVRNALSNAFVNARQLCRHEGDAGPIGVYVGDYHVEQFVKALAEAGFPL